MEERDGTRRRRRGASQLAADFGLTEFADDAQKADKWQLISGLCQMSATSLSVNGPLDTYLIHTPIIDLIKQTSFNLTLT